MLAQLGITQLRPGPSGRADAPNAANYDPAKANPFPDLPELLVAKNGTKITTPEQWWKTRHPEILADFEREVIGRVPAHVPKVTWEVTKTVRTDVGGIPVIAKQVIGHVDNAAHAGITVDIRMAVVTPAVATSRVPVLMMFGFGGLPGEAPAGRGGFTKKAPDSATAPAAPPKAAPRAATAFADPPSTEQLIAAGWGYVSISTTSIQADNGAGLTKGIIGLTNRGQPRKPDDWGSLRAWAWGAARGLDYLETDPTVDAKRVGIEGVSRYGKAALVTMAFEPRFAVVLVGSSGEGGAKLHRRNFGEAVENLTGSGQYHWMAGNFLKYGAAESSFGSKNAHDIPVDAHQLIALVQVLDVDHPEPAGAELRRLWSGDGLKDLVLTHTLSHPHRLVEHELVGALGLVALGELDGKEVAGRATDHVTGSRLGVGQVLDLGPAGSGEHEAPHVNGARRRTG